VTILSGCASSNGGTGPSANEKKIAVVCSAAGQNDNGYNQSAIEGAKAIAAEIGAVYNVVEPVNGVPFALETLAEEGYQLIFSLEYDFDALIHGVGGAKPIAEQYPNTWFVIFNDNPNLGSDGNQIHDNVIAVLFDVHEASYLAGYLSVLVNENSDVLFGNSHNFAPLEQGRAIGFIGGTDSAGITVFSYGFIEGINKAAAELGVTYDYFSKLDAGFVDSAMGNTVAGTFYDNGANIVFGVAGSVGDGITARAREAGRLSIQVDADKDNQQPGFVLTSVMKNTNVPVIAITRAWNDGTIDSMDRLQSYNLASGATGITTLTEIGKVIQDAEKWNEIKIKLESIVDGISSGSIRVINAQIGETFNPATTPNVNLR
jgi:basic membrane protein A